MSTLKLAHISDIHIRRCYSEENLSKVFGTVKNPAEALRLCLHEVCNQHPDVIVITGDLVHEGTADDYAYLRQLIDWNAGGIPVVLALGNHDHKENFYKGYFDLDCDRPYFCRQDVNGYRFLTLDTAQYRRGHGAITTEQVEWLRQELAVPSENGTILALHHPMVSAERWFYTEIAPGFKELLGSGEVLAILCGHTHGNNVSWFGGIPQLTAGGVAFGVYNSEDTMYYSDHTEYSWIEIEGRDLSVYQRTLTPRVATTFYHPLPVAQR